MSFRVGQRVRIATREPARHHRTPWYVKGKRATVERRHASFTNPETRAYGEDGKPEQPLYLVSFAQADLWPGYDGGDGDRLYLDVFEHWLEDE